MHALWSLIEFVLFTLVMLVPLGFCLFYIFISLRQMSIGEKEKNMEKRMGAIKALRISLVALLLVILAWYFVVINL